MQAADTQNPKPQVNVTPQLNKPVVRVGSQGAAVVELQKLLTHWGTYVETVDGIFDISVEDAVRAFQHRVFLVDDGIVGQLTWQALYTGAPVNMPILKQGSQGEAVVTLQHMLQKTSDFKSTVSGRFGQITDAAVRAFQKRQGLVVDGIVGSYTWHALSKVPH